MRQIEMSFRRISGLVLLLSQLHCGGPHMPLEEPAANVGGTGGTDLGAGTAEQGPFYESDVKPIFTRACGICHGPGSPKGNWLDYQAAFARRAMIADRIGSGSMPLGAKLPDTDKKTILAWVSAGAPREPLESIEPTSPIADVSAPTSERPPIVAPPDSDAMNEPAPSNSGPIDGPTIVAFKDLKGEVFEKHCSACHNEQLNLPDWRDYETAYEKKQTLFRRVVEERTMPPAGMDFPEEKRALIRSWIESGALYDGRQANPEVSL